MAFSINRVTLLGNATKDAELRYTPGGQPVARLGVATNRSYKDENDQWQSKPTFHNVTVWGKLAEYVAKTISKGMKVYIDGQLSYSSSEGKDGQKKYFTTVTAKNVIPMVAKGETPVGETPEQPESKPEPEPDPKPPTGKKSKGNVSPDDIPF